MFYVRAYVEYDLVSEIENSQYNSIGEYCTFLFPSVCAVFLVLFWGLFILFVEKI